MRIGIIQPLPGIGDMIIHSSHIKAIVAHYRPTTAILYCKSSTQTHQYAQLLHVDEVSYLPIPNRTIRPDQQAPVQTRWYARSFDRLTQRLQFYWQLSRQLRQDRLDMVFILHHSSKYGLCARLSGIPERLGYGCNGQHRHLTQHFALSQDMRREAYYIQKCDFFLSMIGVSQKGLLPILTLEAPLAGTPTIAIGIGASGVDKQWGSDHFAALSKWLLDHTAYDLILCGGPTDQSIADAIQSHNPQHNHRITSLCNANVYDVMVRIRQSQVYIGNDTGFMHVAVAFGKPSIALFGSPFQPVLDYSPDIHACTPKPERCQNVADKERILTITVNQVLEASQPWLQTVSVKNPERA